MQQTSHVHSLVRASVVAAVVSTSAAAPAARAAEPMTLIDLGSAFSPPAGGAMLDSAVTAAGTVTGVRRTPYVGAAPRLRL